MEAAQIERRHRDRLNEFTRRARRVWAHSLTQDLPQLLAYSGGEMKIRLEERDGELVPTGMDVKTPPEEQLESLAARLRPFTLATEDVQLEKVMKSILTLGTGILSTEDAEHVAQSRKAYVAALKNETYSIEHQDGDELKPRVSNVQLAEAWLYGDVVHNSVNRHPDAMTYGVRERFQGAVVFYCTVALFTLETLQAVLKYQSELGISEASLKEPVVVAEVPQNDRLRFRFSVAELGTPLPEPGMEELGPEWRTLSADELGI